MPTDDSTPADDEGDAADASAESPGADLEPDVPRTRDFTDDEPGLLEELSGRTPEAPDFAVTDSGATDDVDSELVKQFWSLVVIFNVAVFAMALGLMLVGFENRWRLGGAVFAVGVAGLARGWYRYRSVRKD